LDEAFAEIDRRLPALIDEHGRDAVAVYLGNPVVHTLSLSLYSRPLLKALGRRNIYSASTVDQMPKQVAAGLMFGTMLSVPVPDVDRTDHLLILGRQPAGLERQPHDSARHARAAAPHPPARRQGRGDRSTPQPYRPSTPTSITSSAPALTRCGSPRSCTPSSTRTAPRRVG